ncbi:hypothetical protein [Dyadobacter sandarakinus]|uniref:Uncharacterized protein n=1 Tax=Dyadobacter sandarakinus TaxID=2747268 RepID=A0ABX7I106_9BACT|nr:hypothetical protein [Dyadobacter sandarakinus]QRQ99693.1 hypothetical protein HWI92_01570 [Dyadobacter sandarakinus]
MASLSGKIEEKLREIEVGEELTLTVRKVEQRSRVENLAVFISQRDEQEVLTFEDLFEVVGLVASVSEEFSLSKYTMKVTNGNLFDELIEIEARSLSEAEEKASEVCWNSDYYLQWVKPGGCK